MPREEGSVLILALVYLIAVSVTVAALAGWATNDLDNSNNFASARTLQTAAGSAAQLAIQSIRYAPELSTTYDTSVPGACWGTTTAVALDGVSMLSWCSTTQYDPESAETRVVSIYTCLSTVSAASCALQPYLDVTVTFDDYPPAGSAPFSGSCTIYRTCGQGMTVNSWVWTK